MKKVAYLYCLLFLVAGVLLLLQQDSTAREILSQQNQEQQLIEIYLDSLKAGNLPAQEGAEPADGENWEDHGYWYNGTYYYTPEWAEGTLDCVLEIPDVHIRRGVYQGSLEHDLSVWMICAARNDYQLGKTHYVIYGHNHPSQDVSFNRLKDVEPGDPVQLTDETGIYHYTVTAVKTMQREEVQKHITDNMTLSKDELYICTCARNADLTNAGTYLVICCELEKGATLTG